MNKFIFFVALVCATNLTTTAQETQEKSAKYSFGIKSGYNNGFSAQSNFTVLNFIQDTPLHIRLEIGYTNLNPGNAADSRRIFINNATNGTPEKKGRMIDYRLDLLVPFDFLSDSFFKIGPRFSDFKGNFKYVGGNEDFDITSKQWGFGAGFGNFFKINEQLNFEVNLGFDYFLKNTLVGHDTSYSVDNENTNPRNDNQNDNIPFTYIDADKAVNQPEYMPHLMIGINYQL
jgi:hypothetical protein